MESYRFLHTNVIQCQCCSRAQITLGSVIVTLSEEDFIFSKNYFTGLTSKYLDQLLIEPNKKIIIETILPGFSLSLTKEELQWVSDLFTQSALIMEINQVLDNQGTRS